jgi:hypothetical protein
MGFCAAAANVMQQHNAKITCFKANGFIALR